MNINLNYAYPVWDPTQGCGAGAAHFEPEPEPPKSRAAPQPFLPILPRDVFSNGSFLVLYKVEDIYYTVPVEINRLQYIGTPHPSTFLEITFLQLSKM